jgi:hypothetical protein
MLIGMHLRTPPVLPRHHDTRRHSPPALAVQRACIGS